MRPIRFGVLAESAQTPGALLATARRAEDTGCSTLLIRDHLVEGPFRHQLAPLTALTAVAAATARLRVGTLVLGNDYRHPAVLAKEIATLDLLSDGRVELGLGAGFLRREYDEAGLRFDPPGQRVARLAEALVVLKGLLGPDPFTFEGRHYRIDGLDTFPKPVQRPHPPIHVAAGRPRMLALAGREADIVNLQTVSTAGGIVVDDPSGRSPDALARQVDLVREAAAGRDVELSAVVTIVPTDQPRRTAEELAPSRGWEAGARYVLAMPTILIGPGDHLAGLLRERADAFGISYFILSDRLLETARPVLERLAAPVAR